MVRSRDEPRLIGKAGTLIEMRNEDVGLWLMELDDGKAFPFPSGTAYVYTDEVELCGES